ncbi:hypothetical protein [Dysosmobacter sp. Sow4_B12]|uniref:hypothetical protein n=1 Tax=Dysosmobacter sp. Sow4_B12 TaxID=3438777 RepID=UPI003F92E75D
MPTSGLFKTVLCFLERFPGFGVFIPCGLESLIKPLCETAIDWICGRNVEADDSEKEKTLGDIAREIMYMDNMTGVFFSSVTRTERKCISFKGEYPEYEDFDVEYPAIVFSSGNMCSFIKDWQKIKMLQNSYTIDEELYQLWVDKHISDLDKLQAIEPPPDFEHK